MIQRPHLQYVIAIATILYGNQVSSSDAFLVPAVQPLRLPVSTNAATRPKSKNNGCFPTFLHASAHHTDEGTDDICSLDDDTIYACLAEQGFQEDTTMKVSKIMVAQLESLRESFPSFEKVGDNGSNMVKYNKRLKHRSHFHPSLGSDTNSATASITNHHDTSHSEESLQESISTTDANEQIDIDTHRKNTEYNRIVQRDELVLVDTVRTTRMHEVSRAFVRAGPRPFLHYNPKHINAAIVTCGGLCPGLNNVIRELVHALYYLYGVNEVWGVTGGFNGFLGKDGYDPILLTNHMVENIHHEGGTVLRSSRGGFDIDKILAFVRTKSIDHLYVIGGDGTHRAAYKISQEVRQQNLNVAVAGIPKTIDNDVDYIDRSFGFVSAVEAAQNGIRTAKTGVLWTRS